MNFSFRKLGFGITLFLLGALVGVGVFLIAWQRNRFTAPDQYARQLQNYASLLTAAQNDNLRPQTSESVKWIIQRTETAIIGLGSNFTEFNDPDGRKIALSALRTLQQMPYFHIDASESGQSEVSKVAMDCLIKASSQPEPDYAECEKSTAASWKKNGPVIAGR